MRIIFLNIEHGRKENDIVEFIIEESSTTDIFVLQEVDKHIYKKLKTKLPDFVGFWKEKVIHNLKGSYILATFINKNIKVDNRFEVLDEEDVGASELFELSITDSKLLIFNVHGVSRPGDKLDTDARLRQSRKILDVLRGYALPVVIGGDFNLLPHTESINLFERTGYSNLIRQFGIKRTRSKDAWLLAKNKNKENGLPIFGKQLFADYVFTSSEVKVASFSAKDIQISDHLPLILELEN